MVIYGPARGCGRVQKLLPLGFESPKPDAVLRSLHGALGTIGFGCIQDGANEKENQIGTLVDEGGSRALLDTRNRPKGSKPKGDSAPASAAACPNSTEAGEEYRYYPC